MKNNGERESVTGQNRISVHHHHPGDPTPMSGKRTRDRRVQRTEAVLREALAALTREKPYEDIVVKEIVGRANVARSTFYVHYAGKHELLLSCIHEILRTRDSSVKTQTSAPLPDDLLWFSLPILEHIQAHRHSGQASVGPRGQRTMHGHLQEAISDLIGDAVRAALNRSSMNPMASPELVARWIAATFVLVLNWWVEGDGSLSAREGDELFRRLVEPALASGGPRPRTLRLGHGPNC
jgi:AcrR family transcriptional regulator